MQKKQTKIVNLCLLIAITQYMHAENTETHRQVADRLEKKILEKYIYISAEEVAQKSKNNSPISLELLDDLENNADLQKLQKEAPEEIRRLRPRIITATESVRLTSQVERSKKEYRTNMLYTAHLFSATSMIYTSMQLAFILFEGEGKESRAGRCLLSSALGAGFSFGAYYASNTDYFNYDNNQIKLNEISIIQKIVDDKIYPYQKK